MNRDSSSGYVCPSCIKKYPTTHQKSHLFQSNVQIPPHLLSYVSLPLPYDELEDEEEDQDETEDQFDINTDPTLAGAYPDINGPPADWMEFQEHQEEEDYDDAGIEMTEEEDENRRDRLTPNLVGELGKEDDAVKSGEAMGMDDSDVELTLKTAPVDLDLKLGF